MPEDMDIYMKKIKQRADETDNVMGKIKQDKMNELDKLRIDTEMEEVRARLEESRAKIRASQQTGQALAPKQAYNFAELLFAGRPPEEIKQIIGSLDEGSLDKLAYLTAAMNGQQLGVFAQTLRRPETNVKDTIELINTVVKMNQRPTEQQGSLLQGVAALLKEFREAQTPQTPKESHTEKYLDLLLGELKLARQDQAKEREARLEKEIMEIKNKPSGMEEIAHDAEKFATYRKMFGGGDPSAANEYTLKKLEMEQNERVEDKKLGWEMQKHQEEKESEKQLYTLIGKAIDGPVAEITRSLGGAAARRIESGTTKNPNNPQLTQTSCPQCNKPFQIITGSQQVVCPHCSSILGLQQSPPPQQTPPETQQHEEQPPSVTEESAEAPQPVKEPTEQ